MTATEVQIPVPWGFIKGKWWGSKEKQPVLCIHGWQDNAGTFDPLISQLPSTLSFLCIDLPGHGLSSHIPEGVPYYLWWDGVIYLRRIVNYYGWNKVSIMGHSLGGGIGFLYAAMYPDETEALISLDVIAPIFVSKPEDIVKKASYAVEEFLRYDLIKNKKDPVEDYEDMIETVISGHNNALTRKSCETLMKRGMRKTENGKYMFTRDNRLKVGFLGNPTTDLVIEFAKKISCRYMNIKCKPGRTMDNWNVYSYLLDIISENSKCFKFYEVEGDHHIHLNEPSKVSSFIADFLLDVK